MSDTIEREAALSCFHDWIDKHGDVCCAEDMPEYRAIEELPSVEVDTIIRCKDCEWWEPQESSLQGRCELMQMYQTGMWFCGNARRKEET